MCGPTYRLNSPERQVLGTISDLNRAKQMVKKTKKPHIYWRGDSWHAFNGQWLSTDKDPVAAWVRCL